MQRELLLISEMIDAAGQAQQLVQGVGIEELGRDRQRRDALLWNFAVMGEAASQLTDEVKARFPDVPWRGQRRWIREARVGRRNSGSGKTSLARRIAEALGAPYVELDAVHHLAGWQPIAPEEFLSRIASITAGESWVIDGNYRAVVVDGPVWERADTVVWLDLPRRTVMQQVTRRTLRRTVRREELWNGNREPLRNLWPGSHDSILRWAWTQHDKYQDRYGGATVSASLDHIDFVRLRSHAEADDWVTNLTIQPR